MIKVFESVLVENKTPWYYIVNAMAADGQVMEGAWASAAMAFT